MQMKANKASLMTANVSISVSSGVSINAVILDKDGVSPNNKAGCISSLTSPDGTDNTAGPELKPPRHRCNAKKSRSIGRPYYG